MISSESMSPLSAADDAPLEGMGGASSKLSPLLDAVAPGDSGRLSANNSSVVSTDLWLPRVRLMLDRPTRWSRNHCGVRMSRDDRLGASEAPGGASRSRQRGGPDQPP